MDQGLLQGGRLGVGAVEDGHVAPPELLVAAEPYDFVGHPLGLVALVLGAVPDDLPPGPAVGPERLGLAGHVVGDHRVGRVQDGLGGPEVLVQDDGRGVREGLLEIEDVGDVGPPEPVDRLVAVSHHHDVPVLAGQQHGQGVLHGIGVLVLVDQQVGEPGLVVLEHVGVEPEQANRVEQQVVEVHGVGRHHPLLVQVEDVGDPSVEDGHRRRPVLVRALLSGLGLADLAQDGAGRHLLGVEVQFPGHDLHQAAGVGVVVDGEGPLVAQSVTVGPEDPYARRVEGGDPHPLGAGTDQFGHPLAHLVGRLVGEGDGQDLPWCCIPGGDQVGDPPGQHPGLAGAGTGHDEQGTAPVEHRLALGVGEPLQEGVGLHRRPVLPGHPGVGRSSQLRIGRPRVAVVGQHRERVGVRARHGHSHSMVPGGFDVMSRATRLTPSTSLMILEERRSNKS